MYLDHLKIKQTNQKTNALKTIKKCIRLQAGSRENMVQKLL